MNNTVRLEKTSEIVESNLWPICACEPAHVPQSHIQPVLKHLQGCCRCCLLGRDHLFLPLQHQAAGKGSRAAVSPKKPGDFGERQLGSAHKCLAALVSAATASYRCSEIAMQTATTRVHLETPRDPTTAIPSLFQP